ncbi:MAG: AraC family transcriptional regulator ligand-binding domain-containing protein, partial [Colwellia sp.]
RDSEKLSTILTHFNLSSEQLAHQGAILTTAQYAQLLKLISTNFDDESFSATEQGIRCGAFQLMTQSCITCSNLEKSIERMLSFYRVMSQELNWRMVKTTENIEIIFDLTNARKPSTACFSAFMMSIIWRWLSWMIAKPIFLDHVEFTIEQPSFSDELVSVFNTEITFDNNHNKLVFNRNYLTHRVKQTPQTLTTFLFNAPECLLSHYKSHLSISHQVREYIETHQEIQKINLEQLADSFCCSPQTLTRSLRRENTQFKEIKEKVIKQRAINLLLKSELTIEQIAFGLGFAEPSTFYRNFKKWTQLTPSQYRHIYP